MEEYFLWVFHTKLTGGGLVSCVIETFIILSCWLSDTFAPIWNIVTKALVDLFIVLVTYCTQSQLTSSSLGVCSSSALQYCSGVQKQTLASLSVSVRRISPFLIILAKLSLLLISSSLSTDEYGFSL